MTHSVRILSVIAILLGGLFMLKAIAFTNGAVDYFAAYAETSVQDDHAEPESQGDEGADDHGAGEDGEQAAPSVERADLSSVTAAFESRLSNGVRTAEEEAVLRALQQRSMPAKPSWTRAKP